MVEEEYPRLLEDLADHYRGRRTVEAQFVRDVVRLAREGIAAERARAEAFRQGADERVVAVQESHKAALDSLSERLDRALEDALRARRQYAELQKRRMPVEEQEAKGEEGTMVRFKHPENQYGGDLGWDVEGLEAICYKLRVAGGTDHTPVKVGHKVTEALVPFPDFIDMRPPGWKPPAEYMTPKDVSKANLVRRRDVQVFVMMVGGTAFYGLIEVVKALLS